MSLNETVDSPPKRGGKKKRVRKAVGGPIEDGRASSVSTPDLDMIVLGGLPEFDPDQPTSIDIPNDDGTVTITLPDTSLPKPDIAFDDNLADVLPDDVMSRIAEDLLEAIEQDERDRAEWLQQRADGLDLLGTKIERPGGGNVGTSSTAVPGQSTVRDGILGDACERFRANAFAELCPSNGPCKVEDYGSETAETDGLAEDFEKDFNYYLTTVATEYYPDTNKMLWWTGYASGMFKKVYRCPIRNRPVSESVDGSDLIVPSNATDLRNAGRITHQIAMRQNVVRLMQILGHYRDVALTAPTPQRNALQNKEGDITGLNANQYREKDQTYTIYECYTDLDIPGFEHEINGEVSGLAVPYIVVIDKDSRTVLAIRRNWTEPADKPEGDDDTETDQGEQLPIAKIPFVLFPYSLGLGFYGTGLLHKLGNYAMAITAMLRECIDAGMFASFPGFLFAKPVGRQLQNEFRVPPGGGAPIDVSAVPGGNINNAVMPLPYKDVSTAMVALMQQTRDNASRIGGTAESPTGEGVANAPVGSVLAAIDQATRVEGGVHKMLYAAQKEELGLLKELFRDDPEALWRDNKRPAMGSDKATRLARFKQALEQCELVPASDPNVPSHMHRLAKANAYLQMAMGLPGTFNMQNVAARWGAMVKIDDMQKDFAPTPPPGPPPMDPATQATLALKARDLSIKEQAQEAKAQTDAAKIQSNEQIEATKIASDHVKAQSAGVAQPDPFAAAEFGLKAQKQHMDGIKIASDAQNAQADREAKQNSDAMQIASHLATHPEAQPEVNQELMGLAPFMTPSPGSGMSGGGAVAANKLSVDQALDEIDRYIKGGARLQ